MEAETKNNATRLVIVDDHPLVRSGIKSLLQLEDDLIVCGEAEDVSSALEIIAVERPDLVLVDISLKQSSGLDLLKDIARSYPHILTLAVSMHDEYTYAVRCLKAGAKGYIMKQAGTEKILEAIRCVLDGRVYLSDVMTLDAVEQLGVGKEDSEVAEIMNISPRTVEVHRSHIKKKLGLRTGTDMFQAAYEWLRQTGLHP